MTTTVEPQVETPPPADPGDVPPGPPTTPAVAPVAEARDDAPAPVPGLGPSVTASFREHLSLDDLVRAKRRGESPTPAPAPSSPAAGAVRPAPSPAPDTALSLAAWTETLRTLDASACLVLDVPPGARAETPDGEVIDGLDMLAKQSYGLAAYYMSKGPSLTSLYAGAIMGLVAYGSIKWRIIAAVKAANNGGKPGGTTEEGSTAGPRIVE